MGSAISTFSACLRHLGRERAGARALLVKTLGLVAFDIAAADHEIGLAAREQQQHLRQLRLVMLEVGVDHGGIGRARGEDALDAGAGQAAPSDAADTAHPAVLLRQLAHHVPGAVGRIVVDEHDLPGSRCPARRLQPPVQHRDVVALVDRWERRPVSSAAGARRAEPAGRIRCPV